MPERELDCRNQLCPMPIVRIATEVKQMSSGELLRIRATDPAFLSDLRAWSRMTGHTIVEAIDGPVKAATVQIT